MVISQRKNMLKSSIQLLICSLFSVSTLPAQNLIKDPGFEVFKGKCPRGVSHYVSDNILKYWYSPNMASSDFFNTCISKNDKISQVPPILLSPKVYPFEGNGFAGFFLYHSQKSYREYLATELKEPLVAGQTYRIRFYCSISDQWITGLTSYGGIGIALADSRKEYKYDKIINIEPAFEVPEDFIMKKAGEWYKVEGTFIAKGGEFVLIIGGFRKNKNMKVEPLIEKKPPAQTVYVFIDNISLEKYVGL